VVAFALLGLLLGTFLITAGGIYMVKVDSQAKRDRQRQTYLVNFPSGLKEEVVTDALRSMAGTLRPKSNTDGSPSVVFELWATGGNITHRIKIPWGHESYVKPDLENLVPGIRLTPEAEPPRRIWVHATEVGIKNTWGQLDIKNATAFSTSLLTKFSSMEENDTLMMQWVVQPAPRETKPIHGSAQTLRSDFWTFVSGQRDASKDEVADRRGKLDEQNYYAVLRVAAVGNTVTHAQHLIGGVKAAFSAIQGEAAKFVPQQWVSKNDLQKRIDRSAAPPVHWPARLSAPELAACIGWRLGDPMVPGLPPTVSPYIPAPQIVPTDGRVIGNSNYASRERQVAQPYSQAPRHTYLVGSSGTGKSWAMTHLGQQDMERGDGLIAIEGKSGGDSLHTRLLDRVPPSRINDVIVLDFTDEASPLGLNLLEQGRPSVIASELTSMLSFMFSDSGSGLWLHEFMKYAIPTLMLDPKNTIMDLPALARPDSSVRAWRDNLISRVTDQDIRAYWERMEEDKSKRYQRAEPFLTRFHPLTDPVVRNVFGQSKSSFLMDDVIRENKILLVNMAGLDKDTQSILGGFLLNLAWNSAQRVNSKTLTHVFLDEFHRYMKIPVDMESIFAEARSMNLPLTLAHQQLAQIKDESLKQSILTNAATKLVFNVSSKDAQVFASELGSGINASDIMSLPSGDMIAQVMTDVGLSRAFTVRATHSSKLKTYGTSNQVRYVSRQQYGRPVAKVQEEILNRRTEQANAKSRRGGPTIDGFEKLGL
jgi:hypothetical protein